MKHRKPPKGRNLVAKALYESKIFAPKVVPSKKNKVYSRKGRNAWVPSGPYLFLAA